MKSNSEISFNQQYFRQDGDTEPFKHPVKGKCNNYAKRAVDAKIKYIMLHHTVCGKEETFKIFLKGDDSPSEKLQNVAAHFVIDDEGTIYMLINPIYKAGHAGKGALSEKSILNPDISEQDLTDRMNEYSIGIEVISNYRTGFTEEQKESLSKLSIYLMETYNINSNFVIGHNEWAPSRKMDIKGEIWPHLGEYKIGLQLNHEIKNPKVLVEYANKETHEASIIEKARKGLNRIGYKNEINSKEFNEELAKIIINFSIRHMAENYLKPKGLWNKVLELSDRWEGKVPVTDIPENLEVLANITDAHIDILGKYEA